MTYPTQDSPAYPNPQGTPSYPAPGTPTYPAPGAPAYQTPTPQVPKQLRTVRTILLVSGIVTAIASVLLIVLSASPAVAEAGVEPASLMFYGVVGILFAVAYLVLAPKVARGVPGACKVALWLVIGSLVLRIVMLVTNGMDGMTGTIIGALLEIWVIRMLISSDVKAFIASRKGPYQGQHL